MSSTSSVYVNRITVCLTTPQREFLSAGVRRYGIGLSEYMRRILDQVLEDNAGEKDRTRK